MLATCVLLQCFLLVVDSKAIAAAWTILVHELSVFHCDVEYIGFGNAVFGVFFQAQALRPEWPRQHPVQSHVQQRRADPHLKQLLSSSVNILAVALGLANGSECMDGSIALRCLSRTTCCIASASSGRRQVCFVEWGCRKVAARCFWKQLILYLNRKGHHLVECRPSESQRSPAARDLILFGATW